MTASTSHPWRTHWSAPSLAGRRAAFAGRATQWEKSRVVELLQKEGAEVVEDVGPNLSLLVVSRTGTAKPAAEKQAEKLNQKSQATIEILTFEELQNRLMPTASEALEMFRAGREAKARWKQIDEWPAVQVDLTGTDLRGLDLTALPLRRMILDAADFRGTNLTNVKEISAAGANFDGAVLRGASATRLAGCSLIAADARRLQIGNNFRSSGGVPVGSDFSRTDLTISHFHRVDAAGARFTGATLSQALLAESVFPDVDFSHAALEGAVARDANFDGAVFAGANLRNFDAAGCSFQRADFRGARLEGANLSGADLTDARLEGVDLTNVNLGGARIDEAVAGAIGADQRVENVHRAGPLMPKLNEKLERQLDAAVMWRGSIGTRRYRAGIDFQKPSLAAFSIEVSAPPGDPNGELRTHPFRGTGGSLDELFTKIFAYLGPSATLDESSIECFFAEILKVARQALAEAFGLTPPSDDALAAERNQKRRDKSQLKQQLLADLRGGAEGVARWNARPATDFTQVGSLAGIDLSGATLDGLIVGRAGAANRIDLTDARFDGASLVNVNFANALLANVGFNKATLRNVTFSKLAYSVSFADAVLDDVNFHGVSLSLANFSGAKATNCRFTAANLQGADLSQGTFINCDWKGAYYNLDTRFPIGFTDVAKMRWVGPGLPPHELAAAREAVESSLVSATVAESPEQAAARRGERRQAFWEQVRKALPAAKITSALSMLKAEKFELFVDVQDDQLVGVVRSESEPDRVYACRLSSDGAYSCGTQNLRPCGGLRGSPCKHLLILAIGLESRDRAPPERLGLWLTATHRRRPTFDKEQAAALFLRYKGAAVGENDWRPTETTPEDFYVM